MTRADLPPELQASYTAMPPEQQAAMDEIIDCKDRKRTVVFAGNAALMSAAHALTHGTITLAQAQDIFLCTLQFIWSESSNELCQHFLQEHQHEKDPKAIILDMAVCLSVGAPTSNTAAKRLQLLLKMCTPTSEGEGAGR